MVPSHNRKVVSGQSNSLGRVISHKIDEKKMGNRGSKSSFLIQVNTLETQRVTNKFINQGVKEQRVDGSWGYLRQNFLLVFNSIPLRCTLMGFERSYQFKIPSNQLIAQNSNGQRTFSTKAANDQNLSPWFVTGLTDAEGCFTVSVRNTANSNRALAVQSRFQINLHIRDINLLVQLQHFFGGIGHINKSGDMAMFAVSSLKELTTVIIPHFEIYYLLTQKGADFLLFKQIVNICLERKNLTNEGLQQIVNIKSVMNLGLTDVLKSAFTNTVPVERPVINTKHIPQPQWVVGFVNGEGTFNIKTYKSNSFIGKSAQLRFKLVQHSRDAKLMELIMKIFNSGKLEQDKRFPAVYLIIVKFSDILEKVIPLFEQYPLIGVKRFDFNEWCKVSQLMKDKKHLTEDGFNLITSIKAGMNKNRKL